MRKILNALRITLSLRNTININEILHGIRSLPFFGKYISERIYGIRVFKILAMIISVHVEIFKVFAGKIALFLVLFFGSGAVGSMSDSLQKTVYLYGFLLVCLIATFIFNVFRTAQETEYGVFLMGMDAKTYVIARLVYKCFGVVVGYTLFGIPSALLAGVDWYLAILLPVAGVGFRVMPLGLEMAIYAAKQSAGKRFNKKGVPVSIEGNIGLNVSLVSILIIAGMIVAPLVAMNNPFPILAAVYVVSVIMVLPGILLIKRFPYGLYRTALFAERTRIQITKKEEYKKNHGYKRATIDNNTEVKTRLKGYAYLNELFEKRHGKLLWGRLIWTIIGTGVAIALASVLLRAEIKNSADIKAESVLRFVFTYHSGLFTMILLLINSGASMSHAMFSSCDSTMLTYGFYKKPEALRKMFRLRTLSVIKYNAIPALMIGIFSIVVIALTGGEEYPFHYLSTLLMILIALVFFSIRHLTIYYLIQPYTSDFMIKSKLYVFLSLLLGTVFFIIIFIRSYAWVLAVIGGITTIGYYIVSNVLVYKFGPKTFRVK